MSTQAINVKARFIVMASILDTGRTLDTSGGKNLLKNGSKAIYKGGGWWRVFNYGNVKKII